MYIPQAFRVVKDADALAFAARFPFATLVSQVNGELFASHLPLLVGEGTRLLVGHVAKANPHWQAMNGENPALAIFHGPHAYISPLSYRSSPAVPTWNYAAVHLYGVPRLLDAPATVNLLDRMIETFESPQGQASYRASTQFRDQLLGGIVGFEMAIERIEGKFKLGQNRSTQDQQSMLAWLEQGGHDERHLAHFIRERLPTPGE